MDQMNTESSNPYDQFAQQTELGSVNPPNPYDQFNSQNTVQQGDFKPSNQFDTSPSGYGQQVKSSANSFMASVDLFNRQFEKFALGTVQALGPKSWSDAATKLDKYGNGGSIVGQAGENKAMSELTDPMTGEVSALAPTAKVAGAIGSGIAYGGLLSGAGSIGSGAIKAIAPEIGAGIDTFTAAHPLMNSIGSGAAIGSGLSMMDTADTQQQRLGKGLLGGVIGAAIPASLGLLKGIGNWLSADIGHSNFAQRAINPTKAATEDLAYRIKGQYGNSIDDTMNAVNSTKGYLVPVTPGEAFPQVAGTKEATMKFSDIMKDEQVAPRYFSTLNNAKDIINKSIDDMSPANANEIKTGLFNDLKGQYVTPDGKITTDAAQSGLPDILKPSIMQQDGTEIANPLYNQTAGNALSKVLNPASEEWKSLPTNSLAQVHKIKVLLDDDLIASKPNATGVVLKPLNPDEQLAISGAKNQIENILNQSPQYQQAMQVSQNQFIQNTYKNLLDQSVIKGKQQNQLGMTEIKQALFSTPQKQADFVKNVVTTGGDPAKAQAIIEMTDALSMSPLKRVLNSAYTGDPAYQAVYGKPSAVAQSLINHKVNAAYYEAAMKLALNPKWQDEVMNVLQNMKPDQQLPTFGRMILNTMMSGLKGTGKQILTGVQNIAPSAISGAVLPNNNNKQIPMR